MVKAILKTFDIDEKIPNKFIIELSSDEETKVIAGHRFIDLLGKNHFVTRDDLILDLYGIKHVPKNIYMELGVALEEPIVKYVYPNSSVLRFSYEDYKGKKSGAFDLDEEDIGGLPDGIVIEDNTLIEVKCTTTKFKGFKEDWILQAQFYAYWWNKKKAIETGIVVDKIKILKYYVPKELIDAHIKYPNWIISKNLSELTTELNTEEIEVLIQKARAMKKSLINDSTIVVDLDRDNSSLFFQLKKAINAKKLQIEYDKRDDDLKWFARQIYRTKVSKRKSKKKKGLKKL